MSDQMLNLITCPKCNVAYKIPDSFIEKNLTKCKDCGEVYSQHKRIIARSSEFIIDRVMAVKGE